MNCALQIFIRRPSARDPVIDGFLIEDLFLKDTDVSDIFAHLIQSAQPHFHVTWRPDSGPGARNVSTSKANLSVCRDPESVGTRYGMLVIESLPGSQNRYCFLKHTNTYGPSSLPVYRPATLVQFLGDSLLQANGRSQELVGNTVLGLLRDLSAAPLISVRDVSEWFPGLDGIRVAA